MAEASRRSIIMPSFIAFATTTLGALPAFLLSGLGIFAGEELGFDERGIGFAIAAFFGAAALSATYAGRFGDRYGPRRSLRVGVALCAVSLFATGVLARSLGQLVVCLAIGGIGFVLVQMGGNVLLIRAVPSQR